MFYAGMMAGAAYGALFSDEGGIKGTLKGALVGGAAGRYGGRFAQVAGARGFKKGTSAWNKGVTGARGAYKLARRDFNWASRRAVGGSKASKASTTVASNAPKRPPRPQHTSGPKKGQFMSNADINTQSRLASPTVDRLQAGINPLSATMGGVGAGLKGAWNATQNAQVSLGTGIMGAANRVRGAAGRAGEWAGSKMYNMFNMGLPPSAATAGANSIMADASRRGLNRRLGLGSRFD